jgi:hypothetical protein
MPVTRARFVSVDSLPESRRGTAGFGSTGYSTEPSIAVPHEDSVKSGEPA